MLDYSKTAAQEIHDSREALIEAFNTEGSLVDSLTRVGAQVPGWALQ